ncbi:MAG TPA: prepilin peptidase [Longimicrobiales bacterium]
MPDVLIWSYAALLGAMLGSFLNVCIYRLPAGESVVRPRSHCPACGAGIAWYDNVPVLSYLILRGRCRACRVPISAQYPIIELAVALVWAAAAARYGLSVEAVRTAVFLTLLLGMAMTDAREMVIPDHLSLGGLVIGLGLAAVPGGFSIVNAVIGAGVAYAGLRLIAWIARKAFGKPALGLGDVHMLAMIGAFLGISGALLTIVLGSFLGLVVGLPVAWFKGGFTPRGTYIPLGIYLAVGAAIVHGWGDIIVQWYLGYAFGSPG